MGNSIQQCTKEAPTEMISIVLIGPSQSGKSTLLQRIQEKSSAGFKTDAIMLCSGKNYEIEYWDIPSEEPDNIKLKGADCIVIVIDSTSRKANDDISFWIQFLEKKDVMRKRIVLCLNKIDLEEEKIKKSTVKYFVEEKGIRVCEISAATGKNVNTLLTIAFGLDKKSQQSSKGGKPMTEMLPNPKRRPTLDV